MYRGTRFLLRGELDSFLRKIGRCVIVKLGGQGISEKEQLLSQLAQALEFPRWFGGNWDAFDELLADKFRYSAGHDPVVLLVESAEELWKNLPYQMGKLIESCEFALGPINGEYYLVFVDFGCHPSDLAAAKTSC